MTGGYYKTHYFSLLQGEGVPTPPPPSPPPPPPVMEVWRPETNNK